MKHLIMGTAGHVDHGKTALIKALTNIDCDTHKEEKQRGITINLGFSYIDLPSGNSVGIIDVPGHKDFINTMVGGACGIDFVLFVISADSGIMPQTIEHFNILKTLKIKKAIIALTKIDIVDDELAELAKLEIMEWLENTEYKNSPIIGVSSITGKGLDELITEIDKIIPEIEEKEKGNYFRMYIDRIFTVKGVGTIVTGSVLNGEISVGKELFLLPGYKQKLRIRTIERHGKQVEKIVSGDRAAFNLTGLKNEDFKRGMILADKEFETTTMIDAYISLFENSREISLWSKIVFHAGTFESQARMHLLNKDKLKPGERGIVQIHIEKESVLMTKDKFIIRNTSGDLSLGGGVIIDANPLHHRKRTEKIISELELLANGILNENDLSKLIKIELKKENKNLTVQELSNKLLKTESEITKEASKIDEILIYNKNNINIIVLKDIEENYKNLIIKEIGNYHKKNKLLNSGLSENDFFGKLNLDKNESNRIYLNILLQKLVDERKLVFKNNTYLLNNFKITINEKEQKEIAWLEDLIKNYNGQKPVLKEIFEISQENKISQDKIKLYIKYLGENGKLQYFDNDFVHKQVVNEFTNKILNLLKTNEKGFLLKEIREATGITKKLIPLILNYLETNKYITTERTKDLNILSKITNKGCEFIKNDK